MIFHAAHRDLDFELGGKQYVVPKGSDVEIPDSLAYCVASRGIALVEGSGGGKKVKAAKPEPKKIPRSVPKTRLQEMAEELADVTGEDPSEGDDEDFEDEGEAAKALESLQRQGVLPRRPSKG